MITLPHCRISLAAFGALAVVFFGGEVRVWASALSSMQESRPKDVEEGLESVRKLAPMVTASLANSATCGTGIVVGFDQANIYVVTAEHVVWQSGNAATTVSLEFYGAKGKAFAAQVLPNHDPLFTGNKKGLDLAVLRVAAKLDTIGVTEEAFKVLGSTKNLHVREKLYSIGYPGGTKKWASPFAPDEYATAEGRHVLFGSKAVAEGYSGGPLFNSRFQLVGMISNDQPPLCEATSIEAIAEALVSWKVPQSITQGAGQIIIDLSDRSLYPMEDASGNINISIPSKSPDLQAYLTRISRQVGEFQSGNPRYDNSRPRELFYKSFTEKNGVRIPVSLSIYYDSPYFPQYSLNEHVEFRFMQEQNTSFHFFKNAINPKDFAKQAKESDLTCTLSTGWVKYSSVERQKLAEANWGWLSLEYSVGSQTIDQFGYNLKCPKNLWKTNGVISSLLDFVGSQLIIHTNVGNQGNLGEMQQKIVKLRSATQLSYLFFAIGKRQLHLTSENLTRFVGEDGNCYYAYTFPDTPAKLLRLFRNE